MESDMKKLLPLLIILASATGQTPGTITVTNGISAVAGAVSCTFTLATGVNVVVSCKSNSTPAALYGSTLPLPLQPPAYIGNFNYGTDVVTYTFVPPGSSANGGCPAGTLNCWTVVANGTTKSGTF